MKIFSLTADRHAPVHTTKPFRHELKYLISEGEREQLKTRMRFLFHLDSHASGGSYMIRSLYFDDYWNSAYEEKSMGVMERQKYRIRIYNAMDSTIRLERKRKSGSYIQKEAAKLTRDEVEHILTGEYGFLLHHREPLCQEFYVECVSHVMRPRVIVDYDREPFIMEPGTVRVTFDNNVRAAILGENLFDPALPTLPVLEPGKTIMEVKFTEFLPEIVRNTILPSAAEATALSKYVLCYEKTQYLHGFSYWKDNGGQDLNR
ncbi:MAG TPA: transporter [Oribacterium sp.]|nr:transporter [Oribacterium sp.]HCS67849.1 transporter [Oribacterium sp.]